MEKTKSSLKKYNEKPDNHSCIKCGIEKPFTTEYYPTANNKAFGLAYVCKECEKLRKAKSIKDNPSAHTERQKAWSNKNKVEGKCIRCKNVRMETSSQFCENHYLQMMSMSAFGTRVYGGLLGHILKEEQKYKCAYTGIPLVLGVNASVDHVKSRAKHPELAFDLDNVCWVDFSVNLMKREHDLEDFIKYCQMVVDHNKSPLSFAGEVLPCKQEECGSNP